MVKAQRLFLLVFLILFSAVSFAQHTIYVANGWAKNSVNAVIMRHNSLTTYRDTQFIAYYNGQQQLVLAKHKIGSGKWKFRTTPYKGDATDAHRSISIIADGEGYLHVSWDHHGNQLNYCKSLGPGSLELSEKLNMTGLKETKVTYPEFYNLTDGNLLFLYRTGQSGNGDLMMNRYDVKTKKWEQVQDAFINGENQRNAYWQCCVDNAGTIHLSWVWRESGDVETNHDMCYAKSKDGGKTWEKSTGEKYSLPITIANAEYAARIPQKSELINTTSMAADNSGHPYIVTYWRAADATVPQYQLIYNNGAGWLTQRITNRKTPFSLSGSGTKRIPVSRPVILLNNTGKAQKAYVIYRDEEQQNKVTAAICDDIKLGKWTIKNISKESAGMWEPTYDTELWKQQKMVNLFLQNVEQGDGEKTKDIPPSAISVLEWKP
ncbi:BNR repeat-containing protein [Mucilaginibacter sp.]|uniref:BNR repeat-containing protein n=1 Tax=Mucilaginibacter sp. TaxID=1882438 RepID=UPI002602A58B|nr:BNR repeat-containing protein [Mucilaginibacter sp.]MDB4926074.1 hypothetical protein [Mucilaginibacter sp.]